MIDAMAGPMRARIWDCHSFRSRSWARYSVAVSVNSPVTCRVTIFNPFTDGPGEVKVVRTISNSVVRGVVILFLTPGQRSLLGQYCTANPRSRSRFNVRRAQPGRMLPGELLW